MANYYSSDTKHETNVYRPDGEWFHTMRYDTRGEQLVSASQLMDEGYDFDGKGHKVKPNHVELIRKETLTHGLPKKG